MGRPRIKKRIKRALRQPRNAVLLWWTKLSRTQWYPKRWDDELNTTKSDTHMLDHIRDLIQKHRIGTVVETGTFLGGTAEQFSSMVDKVYTIEVVDKHYEISRRVLALRDNVEVILGSSSEKLEEILAPGAENVLFFLDAHWGSYWPLLDELRVIAKKGIKPVIVVHDFYVPDGSGGARFGYDSYRDHPNDLEFIRSGLEEVYGKEGFDYHYNESSVIDRGLIYVEPRLASMSTSSRA